MMRRASYPLVLSFSLVFLILAGSPLFSGNENAPQKVKVSLVSFSAGGSITDINVDEKGNVSVLFLENQNLFFCSINENKKCTDAVRINENDGAVSGAGEATPKMAVALDGKIFVVWYEMQNWPVSQILVSTSEDGGQTFSSPEELSGDVDPPNVLPNVATDGKGNVAVVWLGGGSNPHGVTTHLYLAASSDGGKNFNAPEKINPSGTDVCGCCLPSAQYDENGKLFIAYRDATKNIRDIAVLKLQGGNKYKTVVSNDNWVLNACPNSGPRLSVSGENIAVGWRTKNQPLAGFSSDAANNFSKKFPLDFKVAMNNTPAVVKSKEGTVAVAWLESDSAAYILSSREFTLPAYIVGEKGVFEIIKI